MTYFSRKSPEKEIETFVDEARETSLAKPVLNLQKTSLEEDVYLDPTIFPKQKPIHPTALQHVFITGAAGFVGTHILHQLLASTSADAYCLIRAKDSAAGKAKIKLSLQTYGLWEPAFENRIIPVIGDLSKKQLGLSAKEFENLATTVNHIYHCGALVNFILPYYLLKSTNVNGIQTILELSCFKNPIPITYLSTYSVLFSEQTQHENQFKEAPLPTTYKGLTLGYSQSKWVAEKIVEIAQGRGIPVTTYRLGSITGDSETGMYNRKDFLTNFVDYCIKIQHIPRLSITVDMTPINYAAKAITELSQREKKEAIYHIVNPNPISWSQMVRALIKIMPKIQEIPEKDWISYAIKHPLPDHPFTLYLPLLKQPGFSISKICLQDNQRCDTSHTSEALQHMFCPSINKELMLNYLKGTAYNFPKKNVFLTPSPQTTATLHSIVTAHQPILTQSFMHKSTARAAELINQLINNLAENLQTYKTFFANSHLEAVDGMIKLLRHNAQKQKREKTHIAIFDPDSTLQAALSPSITPEHNLRPQILWLGQVSEISTAIQNPAVSAVILTVSPLLSEYEMIQYSKLASRSNTNLVFDISKMNLQFLPKLPLKVDGVIFGENAIENQLPCGGFSATESLYSVWNTLDNCLLHTSTFGGNAAVTTLLCESLFNTLQIPQTERHYHSLTEKEVYKLYYNYINPKLVVLLKMMGMAKTISYAGGSILKWQKDKNTVTTIDALGSFASSLRGHNPSDIPTLLRHFNTQKNHWKSLKQLLLTLSGFDDVIPSVSGASAVEIALTTALMANPKKKTIITFKNGFSGKTLLSLIGTTKTKYIKPFSPLYAHTLCIDPSAPDAVEQFQKAVESSTVALVWFEMIQGEAGIKPIPTALLQAIDANKKEKGYLVGVDEIQTGLFRTGKFLNYEGKIAQPDIVTIGKGLSDMVCPIGAVLFKEHVLIDAEKTNANYTSSIKEYYANNLSSAISQNALEDARAQQLDQNAKKIGEKFMTALKTLEGKGIIKEVRGEGLLIGIELKQTLLLQLPFIKHYTAALFASCCLKQENSVLVAFTLNNPDTVRIAPSLAITESEADVILATVTKVAKFSSIRLIVQSLI